nr:MAG TPA: Protein of unknown function (DUF1073) [Caudoviricetes sp.]
MGLDDVAVSNNGEIPQDWITYCPNKINPSIKNRRRAAHFPVVYGIINNLILKAIATLTIDGTDEEAVQHILDMDKIWNLKGMCYDGAWKNIVDGEAFYEEVTVDGHADLRSLAFDGERYLIRKLYDDNANLLGYMQLVGVNSPIPKNWDKLEFWELYQNKDIKTVSFKAEDISNPIFIEIDGVGQSLVKNVIDPAYEIESLNRMLPAIVHKSANVMVLTVGNEHRKETPMSKSRKQEIAEDLSDYHKKGVLLIPYGMELDVVGDNVLPKVEDYIKALKSQIYEGLITPESTFSSESSNRSTAEVQLTSESNGHVLLIQFLQEFLKRWLERDLINRELSLIGKPEGSVWINFQTGNINLDNNYLETDNSIETEDDAVDEELGSSDDEEGDDGSGDSID